MPREMIMRMQLTGHMAYDCASENQESSIPAEDSNRPVAFSLEPAQLDQLEGNRQGNDDRQSEESLLPD